MQPAAKTVSPSPEGKLTLNQWLVLAAAFLGWMFDGVEMGLFPLIVRPALLDLTGANDEVISRSIGFLTAAFLVGAGIGGMLFGWLGDRIGRVRAMALSVLIYSVFTGLGALAEAPWHLMVLRFIASLAMGGQWAVAVALVMECWPERHRPKLAGIIGAAANVGFLLIAVVAWFFPVTPSAWRWILMVGASPAVLALLILGFVPESERWKESRKQARKTPLVEIFSGGLWKHTLLAILLSGIPLIGTWAAISGWAPSWVEQLHGNQLTRDTMTAEARDALSQAVQDAEKASESAESGGLPAQIWALWASTLPGETQAKVEIEQFQKIRSENLTEEQRTTIQRESARSKAFVQILLAIGAILGTYTAGVVGGWFGRRPVYFGLCVLSLALSAALFRLTEFNPTFLLMIFLAGAISAAFYGLLPLYLPELFPTRVRATGQGLSFNFGRFLAAAGTLQMSEIVRILGGNYASAGATITLIYVLGMIVIWLGPETKGKPLPE